MAPTFFIAAYYARPPDVSERVRLRDDGRKGLRQARGLRYRRRQSNEPVSQMNQSETGRVAVPSIRSIVPTLIVDGLLPYVAYRVATGSSHVGLMFSVA